MKMTRAFGTRNVLGQVDDEIEGQSTSRRYGGRDSVVMSMEISGPVPAGWATGMTAFMSSSRRKAFESVRFGFPKSAAMSVLAGRSGTGCL